MILCVGLAADETFVHTLLAMKRHGVPFVAIDMAQLVYSGNIEITADRLLDSILQLHSRKYVLGSFQSAWVRLLDITSASPNECLKQRAMGIFRALVQLFDAAPLSIISPPLRDRSNYAKLFHAVELASQVGCLTPRSCLTSN